MTTIMNQDSMVLIATRKKWIKKHSSAKKKNTGKLIK